MLNRRIGSAFVVIGAVLILSALLLFLYNTIEAENAGEAADTALNALQEAIPGKAPSMLDLNEDPTEAISETTEAEEETVPEPTALTYVDVDGYPYVGYLSIPAFQLELPVIGSWSMDMLYKAPCLQTGSPLTNDAVIAGHNYKKHFLPLHNIEAGETVYFVDMTGYVIEYTVTEAKIVAPTNVNGVLKSSHDLVLYTCTSGGQSRVAVFCDRVEADLE